MSRIENLFRDLEELANLPDETPDEYVRRMAQAREQSKAYSAWKGLLPFLPKLESTPKAAQEYKGDKPKEIARTHQESNGLPLAELCRTENHSDNQVVSSHSAQVPGARDESMIDTYSDEGIRGSDAGPGGLHSLHREKRKASDSGTPSLDRLTKKSRIGPGNVEICLTDRQHEDGNQVSVNEIQVFPDNAEAGPDVRATRSSVADAMPELPHPSSKAGEALNQHDAEVTPSTSTDNGPSKDLSKTSPHTSKRERDIVERLPEASSAAEKSNVTTPSSSLLAGPSISVAQPSGAAGKKNAAISSRTLTTKASGSKKKQKEPPMEPPDYARYVMENVKPFKKQIFKDLKIYFNGGDLRLATEDTRKKMTLLVKHGATLLPTYDATTVTHIVTTAEKSGLLKDIGIRSLKSIPRRIPVLAWKWVARSINDGKFAPYHDHPAYSDRITLPNDLEDLAPRPKGKGKEKAQDPLPSTTAIDEVSAISDFTQDVIDVPQGSNRNLPAVKVSTTRKPLPGLGDNVAGPSGSTARTTGNTNSSDKDDPLAPFYAQARAEHEATLADAEALAKDKEVQAGKNAQSKSKKAGFSCDRKGGPTAQGVCPNQDVVDKLAELMEIHRTRNTSDDKWRVLSYTKAISALRAYPHRIKNLTEAKKLPGVGEKTAQKIIEIIDTGRLNRLKYEKTEDVEVIRLFQGIYGVGAQIARQWYAAGCRTLDDLRKEKNGVKLTSVQQIGLKYYDDINTRIPREEAKEIYDKIREIALRLDPKLFIEIMGSYRRGKQTCGDIDILITRPTEDGKTHRGVLWNLMRELHAKGIMTEDLSIPDDWQNLEICYRGLCRRDENSKMRRIDFLSVPYESRGGALLYYTGDHIFNRSMRLKADKMGYSLNQRGLSAGVVRDPQDRRRKLHGGTIIASATEEEIFKMLDVPWQEPHERNRE